MNSTLYYLDKFTYVSFLVVNLNSNKLNLLALRFVLQLILKVTTATSRGMYEYIYITGKIVPKNI